MSEWRVLLLLCLLLLISYCLTQLLLAHGQVLLAGRLHLDLPVRHVVDQALVLVEQVHRVGRGQLLRTVGMRRHEGDAHAHGVVGVEDAVGGAHGAEAHVDLVGLPGEEVVCRRGEVELLLGVRPKELHALQVACVGVGQDVLVEGDRPEAAVAEAVLAGDAGGNVELQNVRLVSTAELVLVSRAWLLAVAVWQRRQGLLRHLPEAVATVSAGERRVADVEVRRKAGNGK